MNKLKILKEIDNKRTTKLFKTGSNLLLRLPKDFTDFLNWYDGDYVQITVKDAKHLEIVRL
jgi:hypothetical protein